CTGEPGTGRACLPALRSAAARRAGRGANGRDRCASRADSRTLGPALPLCCNFPVTPPLKLKEVANVARLPMTETRIISFIVRFVQPEGGDHTAPWHGVVRHVQSSQEVRFTRVEEALQ